MSPERKFYVYAHYRKSDGRVFYIGKGLKHRATANNGRSQYWRRVVNKHGKSVKQIARKIPEACSFSYEKALIFAIGRKNLVNSTDGGEGTSGRVVSQSQKDRCSASNKGTKPHPKSIESARKKNSKPIGTRCGLYFTSASAAARFAAPHNPRAGKVSISNCALGNTKRAYGYEWGYIGDGEVPIFFYKSRMNEPRPYKWRSISCSNGMIFNAVGHAVDWLKSIGHERASTGALCRVAKNGGKSYGYEWSYV